MEQGKACREPLRMLLNLVLEFDRRLLAAKQERHLIDFSDMEHYALQILLKREKWKRPAMQGRTAPVIQEWIAPV